MEYPLDKNIINMLSDICLSNSFVKRGKAFFRIYGDGVLQTIKFQYERVFSHYELYFGLQSMYSEPCKNNFTSIGCIPRFYVFLPEGKNSAVTSKEVNGIKEINIDPPLIQIEHLKNHTMKLLNSIATQESLANALCRLNPIWIDSEKIAPFLAQNKLGCAEKVINSILYQHLPLDKSKFGNIHWSYEDYVRYSEMYPNIDTNFLEIYSWIHRNDQLAIKNYLENNYTINCKLGKFCLKNN